MSGNNPHALNGRRKLQIYWDYLIKIEFVKANAFTHKINSVLNCDMVLQYLRNLRCLILGRNAVITTPNHSSIRIVYWNFLRPLNLRLADLILNFSTQCHVFWLRVIMLGQSISELTTCYTRSIRSQPQRPWGLNSKKMTIKTKGAISLIPPWKYLSR